MVDTECLLPESTKAVCGHRQYKTTTEQQRASTIISDDCRLTLISAKCYQSHGL